MANTRLDRMKEALRHVERKQRAEADAPPPLAEHATAPRHAEADAPRRGGGTAEARGGRTSEPRRASGDNEGQARHPAAAGKGEEGARALAARNGGVEEVSPPFFFMFLEPRVEWCKSL